MFGALAEKKWDPDWKPEFLYPTPAADEEGSVFAVSHNGHHSIWTTTVFDLERGHVQYLYFIEGVMITRIDIHLSKSASGGTDVRVLYERTALDPAANAHVKALGEHDSHKVLSGNGRSRRWLLARSANKAECEVLAVIESVE